LSIISYKPLAYRDLIDALRNYNGRARDVDLYNLLREKYDISYAEFMKMLLTLEVRGVVAVSLMKEGLRLVSLNENYYK